MNRLEVRGEAKNPHEHEGLVVPSKPYYALYSYKLLNSDRFDLLGNSLAILTGIASPDRARDLVAWVEAECEAMRDRGRTGGGFAALFVSVYPAPSIPTGARDTSDTTGPASITTGASGRLSAASMWRHAWRRGGWTWRSGSCWR